MYGLHLLNCGAPADQPGLHCTDLSPCRCVELEGSSASSLGKFETCCKALQDLKVNSAILKATGAGKILRSLAKGCSSEKQKAAGCRIKQVIECWKLKIASE